MNKQVRIIAIDDEETMLRILRRTLEPEGILVETFTNGQDAMAWLKNGGAADVVITDMMLPGGMDGLKVVQEARSIEKDILVVVITAYSSIESAVAAVKAGAYDFIPKPFDPEHILLVVERAVEARNLRIENRGLKRRLAETSSAREIIGTSPAMAHVFGMIEKVKNTDGTVLIVGESGVGKELVARAVHNGSNRMKNPFVALNCGALPDDLLESELFGYEKGAFTGAARQKQGLLETADGGTVFLDEVSSISPMMQVKLLRFLQEKNFMRLGGSQAISVDVRVIAATNEDLKEAVGKGTFRKDLYYRLNVIPIEIPPLRERRDDIPLLVRHFINRFSSKMNRIISGVSKEADALLTVYRWDGNVRELENIIERAITVTEDDIVGVDDLPNEVTMSPEPAEQIRSPYDPNLTLSDLEMMHIKAVLDSTRGNKSKSSRILGIDYTTLLRKLKNMNFPV